MLQINNNTGGLMTALHKRAVDVVFWHADASEEAQIFETEMEILPRIGDRICFELDGASFEDGWDFDCRVVEVTWYFSANRRPNPEAGATNRVVHVGIDIKGVNSEEDKMLKRFFGKK